MPPSNPEDSHRRQKGRSISILASDSERHSHCIRFRGRGAGPGLGFAELVFELVEDAFKAPAALVEQGDDARENGGRQVG